MFGLSDSNSCMLRVLKVSRPYNVVQAVYNLGKKVAFTQFESDSSLKKKS